MATAGEKDRIKLALDNFKLSALTYSNQRKRETEYLRFQDPYQQWDPDIRNFRESQFSNQGVPTPPDPTLSISMIDEPIQLVLNQERAANLEPQVHALTEDADKDTALVCQELNRHIDNDPESKAANARTWAYDRTVKAGLGWYYIDKVFDPDGGHPFDQKLLVKRILYGDAIYPDPTAQMPDWSDGMFLHDIVDYPYDHYKAKWPKSKVANFSEDDFKALGPLERDWVQFVEDKEKRAIRVSNYWCVKCTYETIHLLDDGSAEFESQIPKGRRIATDEDVANMGYGGVRSRQVEIRTIYKSVINGVEELEPEQETDAPYIPYIPTIGVELQPFDGERRWVGMIAGAMDAQRLVNYSASQAVKLAALEPQAPWQAEEGVLPEPFKTQYEQSNVRKIGVLTYAARNAAGDRSTPPARVQVDTSRLGPSLQLLTMGKDFVQRAMFTFGPGLGEQTPAHRSGRAIQELQGQTVQGTSHYLDNMANISMPLEMKIKLAWFPKVYDRPGRILHVITGEGKARKVLLNQPFMVDPKTQDPVGLMDPRDPSKPMPPDYTPLPEGAKVYDLSKGRYGVSVTIGKNNPSRLMEGSDALTRLMEADPQLLPILGPVWAGFQDFPGAAAVKEALHKWQQQVAPWMADVSQQNATQALAQAQGQLKALMAAAQKMKQDLDTDAVQANAKVEIERQRFAMNLELKRIEFEHDVLIQKMKDATEIEKARITVAKEGMIAAREAMEESVALQTQIKADASEADKQRAHEVGMAGHDATAGAAESHQQHVQDVAMAAQANDHALQQAEAQRQMAENQPEASGS